MPTTKRRFLNPNNCAHGAVAVNTVQSITLRKNYTRIAGQGDNDISDTFQAKTNLQVSGTIVIQDPIQADALLDAAEASLSWDQEPGTGGTVMTHTVDGVTFFTLDETDAHNALDTINLGWNAYSPSGIDPHSAALAT